MDNQKRLALALAYGVFTTPGRRLEVSLEMAETAKLLWEWGIITYPHADRTIEVVHHTDKVTILSTAIRLWLYLASDEHRGVLQFVEAPVVEEDSSQLTLGLKLEVEEADYRDGDRVLPKGTDLTSESVQDAEVFFLLSSHFGWRRHFQAAIHQLLLWGAVWINWSRKEISVSALFWWLVESPEVCATAFQTLNKLYVCEEKVSDEDMPHLNLLKNSDFVECWEGLLLPMYDPIAWERVEDPVVAWRELSPIHKLLQADLTCRFGLSEEEAEPYMHYLALLQEWGVVEFENGKWQWDGVYHG